MTFWKKCKLHTKFSINNNFYTNKTSLKESSILEKFEKKNHPIWKSYVREKLVAKFNSRLKKEIR
jgi:hypothetical protein